MLLSSLNDLDLSIRLCESGHRLREAARRDLFVGGNQ